MNGDRIFIIGASGHAKVLIDIIEREARWIIAGLIDTYKAPGAELMGYSILGSETSLPLLMSAHRVSRAIIAVGNNKVRHQLALRVAGIAPQLQFANAVHPSAQIGRAVELGKGIAIMAGATVNSG